MCRPAEGLYLRPKAEDTSLYTQASVSAMMTVMTRFSTNAIGQIRYQELRAMRVSMPMIKEEPMPWPKK